MNTEPVQLKDIFDKCARFTEAKEMIAQGLYPYFQPLDGSEGNAVTLRGKPLIMIGSNNYLGLSTDPRVRQAATEAIEQFGTSCTGSRFLNGTLALHHTLDQRMAEFMRQEAAVCFSTGYHANVGAISALVGRGDLLVTDKEAHASIIDGSSLSQGTLKRFRHNDLEHLETILKGANEYSGVLVAVDGVYSMGGDIAPLPEIVEICKRYGARIMVDDAHGLGVLGGGHGTVTHFGLDKEVDVIMGTFSKSFASLGGVIAGDERTIHYIQHFARSMIFSASMPAANVATVLTCVDIIEQEPERIERLWANTEYMRGRLQRLGYNLGESQTPIIPVFIGSNELTFAMWKSLLELGVYTNPVIAPAAPPGKQLLRTSYMATHTREQLSLAGDAFLAVRPLFEVGIQKPEAVERML